MRGRRGDDKNFRSTIIFHKVARDLQGGNDRGEGRKAAFQMIIYNHAPVRPVYFLEKKKKKYLLNRRRLGTNNSRYISDERQI